MRFFGDHGEFFLGVRTYECTVCFEVCVCFFLHILYVFFRCVFVFCACVFFLGVHTVCVCVCGCEAVRFFFLGVRTCAYTFCFEVSVWCV